MQPHMCECVYIYMLTYDGDLKTNQLSRNSSFHLFYAAWHFPFPDFCYRLLGKMANLIISVII